MGIKYSNIFKALLLFCLIVFTSGCKDDPKRHLELGEWYANKGLVEEAILEFKEVTRLYPTSLNKMNRDDFQSLSKAHYNLSLMYTKKGWWDYALSEAKRSFDISPNKDCHELITLIEEKLDQDSDS